MSDSHDNEPVLKPSEFLDYRRRQGQLPDFQAPRAVMFAPQKSLAEQVLRRHPTRQIKGFIGELYLLKQCKGEIALCTGFGIGAPAIAALTDQFAALGTQRFGLLGLAGGVQPELTAGSLVISTGAIRGEGVSRHYMPPQFIVNSSQELVNCLSTSLHTRGQHHVLGTTWTTDAPFRELRRDVLEFQRQSVLAVDMEAAAMLAVAGSMNLAAVAAFSIADQLSDGQWRMSKDLRRAQTGLTVLFDAMMLCFTDK